jgi:hypothetical protein
MAVVVHVVVHVAAVIGLLASVDPAVCWPSARPPVGEGSAG